MADDFLLKNKLTDDEEIQLLKKISEGFDGTDLSYYKPHLDKIIIKYKENMVQYKKLQYENQSLKERLKIVSPQWKITRNCAQGIDPIANEIKEYDIPLNFDEENVRKLHSIDDAHYMCYFTYYIDGDPACVKEYDIPWSLYDFLSGKEIKESRETDKIDIHSINDIQDMKKYIHSIDNKAKIPRKYFDRTADFLLSHRESKFKFEEIQSQIKYKSRQTAYDLLNDFEKWGFLRKGIQGYWQVIF